MIEKKYYKRREVAEIVGVRKETLTHWEKKIGDIFYCKKDKNDVRSYDGHGIDLFKKVFDLRFNKKHTLEGVKDIILSEKEGLIDSEWQVKRVYDWLTDENREPAQTKS